VLAGNPRSGSHALALELERYGGVAVPTEPRFATLFARHARLAGDLAKPRSRKRLLRCIFAFLWLWEGRNRSRAQLVAALPHSMLTLASRVSRIAAASSSYGDVVQGLYAEFAQRRQAALSLDKVTFLCDEPIGPLASRVPGLKVVHVVRDGRDVALSWRGVWFGVPGIAEAALRWRRRVEDLRAWGERHPDAYLEVRYEDFVADPEATCERILAFLGVGDGSAQCTGSSADTIGGFGENPSVGSSGKGVDLAMREGHERLAQALDASRAQRWQREMPALEYERFERIAGDALRAFGYRAPEGSAGTGSDRRALGLARGVATLDAARRPTFWKQCAVSCLAPALLLSDRIGLPFSRLLYARALRFVRAYGGS
jgi:hypothetical protein